MLLTLSFSNTKMLAEKKNSFLQKHNAYYAWEKQKNFDLVSIELKEIKKINEKLINIIKLLFVISLSVYVIFFIIFYRSAIRF